VTANLIDIQQPSQLNPLTVESRVTITQQAIQAIEISQHAIVENHARDEC
jgi:hypothetical protein